MINSGTPTVPTPTAPVVAPTSVPVNIPAPIEVVPNPSGIPYPCCSWYSNFCEQSHNTWCHTSEANCNTCSGVYWDPYNQPQPTPTPPGPTMPNPTAPTPLPPTDIPTTGIPCCSINLKDVSQFYVRFCIIIENVITTSIFSLMIYLNSAWVGVQPVMIGKTPVKVKALCSRCHGVSH